MVSRFTAVTAAMLVAASATVAYSQTEKKPKKDQPSKQREKEAGSLSTGDKAPALTVEQFVKGNKVNGFENGKVYVVEFWATWCGPCIANIPHLTQIQKEFKDKGVTVIGVAASENGSGGDVLVKLKKFVQSKGDEMGYTVAYDQDKSMGRTWMQAAGVNGIPHAFVVGKDGKIAWHGHPADGLEDQIKKALASNAGKKDEKKGAGGGSSGSGLLLIAQPEKKAEKGEKAKKEKAEPARTVFVGDKAPEITVAKWVKGEPVTGFEKGKTYVVEFWATWCGPCKKSIPHLTELQKEYKDRVKFVGVSVYERDPSGVEAFVEKQGDQMGYTVAIDDVPADGESSDGKMAVHWMGAAGQNSIPTAFIVNGDGKIAWIGSPLDKDRPFDEVLEKVVAGKWDIEKESAAARKAADRLAKLSPEVSRYQNARAKGDVAEQLAAIDAALEVDPGAFDPKRNNESLAARKFVLLLNEQKDYDKAYSFARQALDGPVYNDPMALNEIAWTIVDPKAMPEKQDLKLALRAAQRAYELTEAKKDPAITDTLAKVYHDQGNLTKAIELQEKAAKWAEGTQWEQEIGDRLDEYKAEAKKAK